MMRMEVGDMSTVIINAATGEIQTLIPGQKMAMKMNMDAMKKMQEQAAASQPAAAAAEFKVALTGKSETIAGYDAEEVTITSLQMTGSMWVARDFPQAAEMMKLGEKMGSGMKAGTGGGKEMNDAMAKAGISGYPMKMDIKVKQGGGEMHVVSTVTKVEEKDIDANLFTVPADYKIQDMGDMLRGATPPPVPAAPAE
jgi:hypothetical protein